jgi:hypothetical protein
MRLGEREEAVVVVGCDEKVIFVVDGLEAAAELRPFIPKSPSDIGIHDALENNWADANNTKNNPRSVGISKVKYLKVETREAFWTKLYNLCRIKTEIFSSVVTRHLQGCKGFPLTRNRLSGNMTCNHVVAGETLFPARNILSDSLLCPFSTWLLFRIKVESCL